MKEVSSHVSEKHGDRDHNDQSIRDIVAKSSHFLLNIKSFHPEMKLPNLLSSGDAPTETCTLYYRYKKKH